MNAQQSTGAQGWMNPKTGQSELIFTKTRLFLVISQMTADNSN